MKSIFNVTVLCYGLIQTCLCEKILYPHPITQIAKLMGPTRGPPGSCRSQMGPMLAPWTLLSGKIYKNTRVVDISPPCYSLNDLRVLSIFRHMISLCNFWSQVHESKHYFTGWVNKLWCLNQTKCSNFWQCHFQYNKWDYLEQFYNVPSIKAG